jgi:hypothetical protein
MAHQKHASTTLILDGIKRLILRLSERHENKNTALADQISTSQKLPSSANQ